MRSTLFTCSCLLAALPAQQSVSRTYDLGALLHAAPTPAFENNEGVPLLAMWPRLPLARAVAGDDSGTPWLCAYPAQPRAGVLRHRVAAGWDWDAVDAEFRGDRLYLSADPASHRRVRETIAALAHYADDRVELTIFALPRAAVRDVPAVLDSVATARLLEQAEPRLLHRATFAVDMPHVVEQGRQHVLVLDYDVEVAQDAYIADPKTRGVFAGRRLGCLVSPLADERLLLTVGISETHVDRPVPLRRLRGRRLGNLHRPVVDSQIARTAAALASDGAILLQTAGDGPAWLLRVRHRPAPPALEVAGAEVAMLPLADALHPHLEAIRDAGLDVRRYRPGHERVSGTDKPEMPNHEATIASLLRRAGVDGLAAEVVGNRLLARGPKESLDRLRATMRTEAQDRRSHGLEFRVGRVDRTTAAGLADGSVAPADVADRLAAGRIAALPGHAFRMLAGREFTFVRDEDVEIAQEASAANPIVDSTFAGTCLDATLHRTGRDALRCVGRLTVLADAEPTELELGDDRLGNIDTAAPHTVELDFAELLQPGDWRVVGPRDLGDPAGEALVLLLRVR